MRAHAQLLSEGGLSTLSDMSLSLEVGERPAHTPGSLPPVSCEIPFVTQPTEAVFYGKATTRDDAFSLS